MARKGDVRKKVLEKKNVKKRKIFGLLFYALETLLQGLFFHRFCHQAHNYCDQERKWQKHYNGIHHRPGHLSDQNIPSQEHLGYSQGCSLCLMDEYIPEYS